MYIYIHIYIYIYVYLYIYIYIERERERERDRGGGGREAIEQNIIKKMAPLVDDLFYKAHVLFVIQLPRPFSFSPSVGHYFLRPGHFSGLWSP